MTLRGPLENHDRSHEKMAVMMCLLAEEGFRESKQLSEGARSSLEDARSDLRRRKIPTPESSCHIRWPFSLQAAKVQIRDQRMRRLAP
jgi:hypothetical protein